MFRTGPGRIDIIDGQVRFDVAQSWVSTGHPFLRDPALAKYALRGVGGFYSPYNAGASVAAIPFVWLGGLLGDPSGEVRRFLFSFTSGAFAALLCVTLFLFLQDLGFSRRASIGWSMVAGVCSYLWPLAVSVFDQAQHAFFVVLALFLAYRAARRGSTVAALGSGLSLGALLNYQESYLIIVPGFVLPLLLSGPEATPLTEWRARFYSSRRLILFFVGGISIGLAAWFEFNQWRFGVPYLPNRFKVGLMHPPLFGNPIIGFLSLLLSPGKSVFLYDPVLILGIVGWGSFRRRFPGIAWAILVVSVSQLLFVSCLTFFGSDWAWGPRYLLPVLSLWILPAAAWFQGAAGRARRLAKVLILAGLAVQAMGVSLDQHRFFYQRDLRDFFWYVDPWYYLQALPRSSPGPWES